MNKKIEYKTNVMDISKSLEQVAESIKTGTANGHTYVVITSNFEVKTSLDKNKGASLYEITNLVKDILSRREVDFQTKQSVLSHYNIIRKSFKKKELTGLRWFLGPIKQYRLAKAKQLINENVQTFNQDTQVSKGLSLSKGAKRLGKYDQAGNFIEGTVSFPDGTKWKGTFKNGKLNGQGMIKDAKGKIMKGKFQSGKLTKGKITYPDGTIKKGTFTNDLLNGSGNIKNHEGTTIQEGIFSADELTDGKMIDSDGRVKEGHFTHGQLNGDGKILNPDKTRVEGQFQNGLLHGQGEIISSKGILLAQGEFKNGTLITGYDTKIREEKKGIFKIEQGLFQNDRLMEGKITYQDGKIEEGIFHQNGHLIQGKRMDRKNQIREEGHFKNGKLHGQGMRIDEKSLTVWVGEFHNGQPPDILGKRESKTLEDGTMLCGFFVNISNEVFYGEKTLPNGKIQIGKFQKNQAGQWELESGLGIELPYFNLESLTKRQRNYPLEREERS